MQMDKKIVLITGANSGVGLATARQLAACGAAVVMVCRDSSRGLAAKEEVSKVATGPLPTLLLADLSSQSAVRILAKEVRSRFPRIDVLINNAGAIFARREFTVDGIEKTFAVNHLAPFLLTTLLLDLVVAAPEGRILNVSSESHSGALDFDNLQGELSYNFFANYNRSKLENVLFTYELAARLKGTRATANCLSPGPTVTKFGNEMTGLPALFPLLMKKIPFLFGSPDKGAKTSVYLASSPEVKGVSGKFFLRCREKKSSKISHDTQVAARLWRISEELCGIRPIISETANLQGAVGSRPVTTMRA